LGREKSIKFMSEEITQIPAFGIQHSDFPNYDPRCPSILVLDVSASMTGRPIIEVQDALAQYIDELATDSLAKRRVEIAVVSFGGTVQVLNNFSTPDNVAAPTLKATGDTPMGEALVTALDLLKTRKSELASQGIQQYRAWVILITDGAPTDENLPAWAEAVAKIREGEQNKSFLFFAVGVGGANMEKLKELCSERPPMLLNGLQFRALFQWLSASQKAIPKSNPGDKLALPPVDWGTITA
jgi:uncharacterized protein YegL